MGVLFSDDFGGSGIDATRWDVLDGGLAAITSGVAVSALGDNPTPTFNQAKIGSGTTGITDSFTGVALSVSMNTTNGAERWYLSRKIFAGAEDITVHLSRSQALAANSIFVGLVEVDALTGIPLLNPNITADGNGSADFTNRAGVDYGKSTGTQQAFLECVADSSNTVASVTATTFAPAAMTTAFKTIIEFHAEDMWAGGGATDVTSALASSNQFCLNSQAANDGKAYKLLIRFRNVAAPGSGTTVVIPRILVVNSQEMKVEVVSGRGDLTGGKGVPVNVSGNIVVNPGGAATTSNGNLFHKLTAAATTNATSVKTTVGKILGGRVTNLAAAVRYLKFYNKASAPTVGTDTPILTIPIEATSSIYLADIIGFLGMSFTTGIAYALTTGIADGDTGALTAGDVQVNLLYI